MDRGGSPAGGVQPDLSDWTTVCPATALAEGKAIRASVGDLDLFLYMQGDRVFALANRCTHQGGPLHKGRVNPAGTQPTVTCPVHGSMFWMTDGRVVRGPASVPQPVYDARLNGDMVEVRART